MGYEHKCQVQYSQCFGKYSLKMFSNVMTRFVSLLLDHVSAELAATGDRDWLVEAGGAGARVRVSQVEGRARRVASGLARLGLGPGDILHTAYNSNLEFYWPLLGAWLCGAAVR